MGRRHLHWCVSHHRLFWCCGRGYDPAEVKCSRMFRVVCWPCFVKATNWQPVEYGPEPMWE